MGIIIKQSIKGSIWSYIGVLIAFVTTSFLYPKFLTTELVGLFGLLISYSTLFGQISLLGFPGITSRLFPHFRDPRTKHHGFSAIALLIILIGFSLFLVFFFLFSPWIIENNQEKSRLFSEHVYLLIPITFFTMLFIQLDTYNKVLYDALPGIFLQEFLQRFLLFGTTLLFALGWLSVAQLIWAFAIAVSLKGIIITVLLQQRKELSLNLPHGFVTKEFRREMVDVGLFSIISGLGSMIIFNLDKIIINQMLDLDKTGVYTIAFYFGTLVIIPSRPLLKISGTLIADAWAKNDLNSIRGIYYKSCLNQFIIGGFLFLGIWANIDNILEILGPDYQQSKWVIFFVGIAYLFDMLTGANAQIIAFSKYYRVAFWFVGILLVIVLSLLFLLIPIWGIVGAAMAIAGGLFLNNLMRYLFLFGKFKMQPFNLKFVTIPLFYVLLYYSISLIPQFSLVLDIAIRGTAISLASLCFFYFAPVSTEIKSVLDLAFSKIKHPKK
ncbi:lipopolysaccharide biosynthesis protein [Mangrovibacterium sp.]|uniref:lipopolysaccharide biosynthesis protein n=1 Tax=Mangrovibacterium sp. TaxID=1961364 RepID=UPI003569800C